MVPLYPYQMQGICCDNKINDLESMTGEIKQLKVTKRMVLNLILNSEFLYIIEL